MENTNMNETLLNRFLNIKLFRENIFYLIKNILDSLDKNKIQEMIKNPSNFLFKEKINFSNFVQEGVAFGEIYLSLKSDKQNGQFSDQIKLVLSARASIGAEEMKKFAKTIQDNAIPQQVFFQFLFSVSRNGAARYICDKEKQLSYGYSGSTSIIAILPSEEGQQDTNDHSEYEIKENGLFQHVNGTENEGYKTFLNLVAAYINSRISEHLNYIIQPFFEAKKDEQHNFILLKLGYFSLLTYIYWMLYPSIETALQKEEAFNSFLINLHLNNWDMFHILETNILRDKTSFVKKALVTILYTCDNSSGEVLSLEHDAERIMANKMKGRVEFKITMYVYFTIEIAPSRIHAITNSYSETVALRFIKAKLAKPIEIKKDANFEDIIFVVKDLVKSEKINAIETSMSLKTNKAAMYFFADSHIDLDEIIFDYILKELSAKRNGGTQRLTIGDYQSTTPKNLRDYVLEFVADAMEKSLLL